MPPGALPSARYDRAGRALGAAVRAIGLAALLAASGAVRAEPYVFAEWRESLSPGIGYRMSERFAIELAHFKQEERGPVCSRADCVVLSTPSATREVSGARLSLVGSVPVTKEISLLGSVGAYRLRARLHEADGTTSSGSGTVAGVGLGASYAITREAHLRAMVDWVQGKSDMFGPGKDLERTHSTAFALLYHF